MYKVYDLETGTRTHLKRKASRWHPENYIVALGWKNQGDKKCSWRYNDGPVNQDLHIEEDCTLLVGFNLKFDLLWQWDNPELRAFFKRGGRIWDCQYVEYLLQGQDPKYHYPALTDVAPDYGGTKKIDEVKILWDQGVMTEDINKDLLIDYLVGTPEEGRNGGDIGNTEKVFLGQVKKAREAGMLEAIWSRMDGLCATTEMEYNGLQLDMQEARKQLKELTAERAAAAEELAQYVPELPEGLEFKWGSPTHKSCLIFGGTVKYQKQAPFIDPKTGELARFVTQVMHYVDESGEPISPAPEDYMDRPAPEGTAYFQGGKKKGLPKTKKVKGWGDIKTKYQDYYFTFDGFTEGRKEWETKNTDASGDPIYSTASEKVMALAGTGVPFCEVLASYEAINKELTTYFVTKDKNGKLTGMLTCVDPSNHRIHHSLNHCATVTSRLSSSDPNLQNIPRADKSCIKRLFVSRFKNGTMLEADYSQLEVVVQGVLSGDPQLCQDLRDKVDFHCKRVAIQPKYNTTYQAVLDIIHNEDHPEHKVWKKRRTGAKIFSFQRAYGAGAYLIALSTGMDVEEVKALIAAEEETYPGVKKFNESVEETVKASAEFFRDPVNNFKVYRRGKWVAPTGCIYTFRSYDPPDFMKERGVSESFKPTELKNYPVQGTGGEIVQGICGRLWRHFVANDNYGGKAVLCNTVHDCVWVDSSEEVRDEVAKDVKDIMERVPEWFELFGVKITVPFPVEVEYGPNMLDLKHVA